MTTDEKLAAIQAAIQTDPGNRGLKELFGYCPGDFSAACQSLSGRAVAELSTGFYIPSAEPPAFETDGPLGAVFLYRALDAIGGHLFLRGEPRVRTAIDVGLDFAGHGFEPLVNWLPCKCSIWLERAGPSADNKCYTMRGRDISEHLSAQYSDVSRAENAGLTTIGIGDGGNEIGMGKIPHETVVKNIPNGDLIHCRVPTDHLIVAGVSNWGAYALAAGVCVLRGVKPPPDLFDPDREREILDVMVREGPLVDGVTGKQTATVDGLTWDEYVKPLVRIRDILES
jgi:hypothetical protein